VIFSRDPLADPEPLIRRVYAYVAYRVGDGPDAEDLTSETFERAVRYRKSFDSTKGVPISWLLGIARRCIDSAAFARPPAPQEIPDAPAPGDLEEEAVTRVTLAAAVSALGERDRELVALRYGADLTSRQIGELLGARTNTIEVALHRALARLRALLEGSSEAGEGPPSRQSEERHVRREVGGGAPSEQILEGEA
jgi:RNA polymerase sigma-70 factor, ECF subfamily